MADDWVDVPALTPVKADDGWESVPAADAAAPTSASHDLVNATPTGGIMSAFGQGFREASGPEPLGLSPENQKWLSKIGIFAPEGQKNFGNPFQAFNEGVILPAAAALDGAMRMFEGTYRGLQAAGIEAGLPKDVVSIPDAFAGSPGALGEIRVRSGLPRDRAAVGPPLADLSPAPPIQAYHGSPYSFDAFSTAKIGTGEGAQAYGHGLYFAEKEGVANSYKAALSDSQTVAGEKYNMYNPAHVASAQVEESGSRAQAIKDTEARLGTDPDPEGFLARVLYALKKDGPLPEFKDTGNLYQVSINVDQGQMLDWDKPLNEQPDAVRKAFTPYAEQFGPDATMPALIKIASSRGLGMKGVSEMLQEAGVPGIKYFDGGSRAAGDGSRNFVVFNENDVQITHKNGVPIETPQDKIASAKDMGVIGADRPPITEGNPAEAAQRTVAAAAKPGESISEPGPGEPNPWRERFDGFVSKIKSGDDVKQLITEAADQNGEFQAARQGDIPLHQFGDLTEAAGVDPATVNRSGVGRLLKNDNEVRNAMQAMLTATEQVKDAAREVKADGSPESLMKLQEAMLRRDTAVEQVVGHRAEWGRTGNVFQEFLTRSKEEGGFTAWLKEQDRSPEGLRKIADAVDNLDPAQAAKFLSDANKPTFWDKFKYYWVNSLISGPFTHAKYVIANAAFAGYEAAAVTPVAGVIGAGRRALTGGAEGVFAGEAAARTWGLVAGVPDAVKAAVSAAKTGLQTPLPGEVAQGIIPKNNKNVFFQQRPIPGNLGAVIGVPSRGASAIHSFFNFLGYRASIEAQAYRQAAKEGLSISDDAFWQRREAMAARPTEAMMNDAIEEGYRGTYISELGKTGKALQAFVRSTKVGQILMPFTHIPLKILETALQGTPAAFLDPETRAALSGEKGAAKQDMAVARMVAGSAVGTWAINQVLNERMTGSGPTDPKERAQWLATGHQPYSIRIGDYWYSFNRFGSLGTMLGLYSNLAEVIPHIKPDAEELTKAIAMTVHSTGRLLEDEVGMQGFAGLVDAISDPIRNGPRYVANMTGSFLPMSSFLRQTASSMDPYMRETKSVVDGLRYYIPVARQGLLPKRDWSGMPVANAGYGGDTTVPGMSSIIQHRNAVPDPVAQEFTALDLHPAPPQDRIKGVKLPPKLYDTYQSTVGPFTRSVLEQYVSQPGWHDIPVGIRKQVFESAIRSTREAAGAAMQMRYPELIQQGVTDRINRISGVKPGKLLDQ